MKSRKSFLVALASLLSLAIPGLAGEFPDKWTFDDDTTHRSRHAALEGKPMPSLPTGEWTNGEVKSADLKGKVVVVDFYATWCGPCMAAVPHNNELAAKYKSKGLVVLGVCTNEKGQEEFTPNAKKYGMKYPLIRDPDLKAEKAWAVQYYPTYAVIDRKGVVRAIGLQPQHVETVVQKLLAEPAP